MSLGYECTLRRIFRPELVSDDSSTIDLHVRWKHYRRVFQRTNHGSLPPTVDEPIGASSSSHFGFRLLPISEFPQEMRIAISILDFPHGLSILLYHQVTSMVVNFVAESPTGRCPSLVLVAEINFIHRVYADYDPRPLESIPPRQLAASADGNSIPDTTTEGLEVDRHLHSSASETSILRGTTEEWGGDGGQRGSFFDENFILGTPSEVDEDNNAGTEMLGRIEGGEWAKGGGGEVTCSVCLEEFSEGQEVMTLACEHRYHEQCLLTWLNRNQTCPLCRRPI